jgi:O-antigen/teichoic acid export membrane protein
MNQVKQNISANIFGNSWQAIMGLVFVPLYIKFMGVESYGLIGIFAILQMISGILDMGLSGTMNREMARLSVLPGKKQEARNLARSLEIIYWGIALVIGIAVIVVSPFIAHHWVRAEQLSSSTIEQAVFIMGFTLMLQCTSSFYASGLMGLQRQITLNAVNIGISTLRGIGAVAVLWLISPTIQAFFLWQIVISAIHTFLLMLFLWHRLPSTGNPAVFQKHLLKGIWRFAAGISGTTILGIIITQTDKIILSKMLSLEMFGYYTLASLIAMSPLRLSGPMFFSIYPRFTQLVSLGDQEALKQLYHKSCQFMAVLILPASIVIALYSYEIILLWTQNPVTAERSHLLVSILICGTALNALMHLPHALQWSSGWTRLSFFRNLLVVGLLVPLMIYMTFSYGAVGAASVWLISNLGYVLFEVPLMHRRLLREEKWRWYWQDVLIPLAAASAIAASGKLFISSSMAQLRLLIYLSIVLALTLGITAIITPVTRDWLWEKLLKIKSARGLGNT